MGEALPDPAAILPEGVRSRLAEAHGDLGEYLSRPDPLSRCECTDGLLSSDGLGSRYCECRAGEQALRRAHEALTGVWSRSGRPERLRTATFESARRLWLEQLQPDFEHLDGRTHASDVTRLFGDVASRQVLDRRDLPRAPLLLGRSGLGKSGLLSAAYSRIVRSGRLPLWLTYEALVSDVQAGYTDGQAEARRLCARRWPILILDDLGDPFRLTGDAAYQETVDKRRIIWDIIEHRHGAYLPTLVSANYASIDDLAAQFDPRVADRLREMCAVCVMTGPSLRGAG